MDQDIASLRRMIEEIRQIRERTCDPKSNQNPRYHALSSAVTVPIVVTLGFYFGEHLGDRDVEQRPMPPKAMPISAFMPVGVDSSTAAVSPFARMSATRPAGPASSPDDQAPAPSAAAPAARTWRCGARSARSST